MGKLINSLIKSIKIPGFTRSGNNWIKSAAPFDYLINLQSSKSNGAEESFTFNVSIFHVRIHELVWQKPAPPTLKETDGVFRARISHFMGGRDYWWTLTKVEDLPLVQAELTALLSEIVKYLESINTLESLKIAMHTLPRSVLAFPLAKIQLASIHYLLGDVESSVQELSILAKEKVWGENAQKVLTAITTSF